MKHFLTHLLAAGLTTAAIAQPNCEQIIQAAFTPTVQGSTVVFNNSSQSQFPQSTTYQWSFGDGASATGNIVTHIYDQPGTYWACLYAVVENCVDSVCHEVVISGGDPCSALTDVVTTLVPQQGGVSYAYANVPQDANTIWYFGDGTSSNDAQGFHQYQQPGTYTVCLWTWFIITGTSDTCSSETCHPITIEGGSEPCEPVHACFQWGGQNGMVQFSNCSTTNDQVVHWNWVFGDGNSSEDQQPSHTFAEPGVYTVCLTVWTGEMPDTCSSKVCHVVVVEEGSPCDNINAGFNVGVQGSSAYFHNTVSSNNYSYSWTFGDGTSGSGPDPVHTYQSAGTYHACLLMWAWDPETQDSCFADHCEWVTINSVDPCDSLHACFQWGGENSVVQFYNCSYGEGQDLNYTWHFGDGTSSDAANPLHTFPEPGTYTVCLTAWLPNSPDSCSNTICHTVVVDGGGSPCDGLNAGFSVNTQGSIASFDNVLSSNNYSYYWSFGDGTTGDGPDPIHTYPEPGTYHACLTMWTWDPETQDTCYADHCEWVTIGGGDPCDSLYACFQWGGENSVVQFYNCSYGGGQDLNYTWHFGDGTTSDAANPLHTFPEPGTYTVCLTAWSPNSPDSCSNTICNTVVVGGGGSPCDGLNAAFSVTTQGSVAFFDNVLSSNNYSYYWHFGDGTTGDGPDPIHTYPEPGTYHACLTMWTWDPETQDTCYAEHCEWVTIGGSGGPCDSLSAEFWWGNNGGGANSIFFSASSPGSADHWLWSFGDGSYSDDGPQGTHTYDEPGSYELCLTVWAWIPGTNDTCSTTSCQLVVVGGGSPCDSLSADFVVTTQENLAAFTTFGGTAIGYHWTFGDGTEGDGSAPTHTYPGPGTYHACLVTWTWDPQTQDTCYADHCEWITFGGSEPCDSLQAGFEAIVGDATVWFSNTTVGTGFQTTWFWDFGDGTTSNDAQPSHIFPGLGTYEVCLTVTTLFEQQGGGVITCEDTYCQLVTNGGGSPCDQLNAEFTATVSGLTIGLSAGFNPPGTSYEWIFGDGTFGDGANATHTYPGPGEYHVCLVVGAYDPVAEDSCFEDHCTWITLQPLNTPCDSLWNANFEFGHQGNVYTFYNTSNTQGTEVSTSWTFGDGTGGEGSQIVHTYTESGTITVCMTITGLVPGSDDTCSVTTCETIEVVTGLGDLGTSTAIAAWPQPFDQQLQLDGPGLQGNVRFTLVDMTGRIVDERSALAHGRITLDYAHVPTGAYVLRVRAHDLDRVLRVIRR